MDNSGQSTRPIPNRGGILVEPVAPVSEPISTAVPQVQPVSPPSITEPDSPVANPNSKNGASNIDQPNSTVSSQPVTTAAPQNPVGSKNREQEPSKTPFPDVVKMTEAEAKKVEGEVEKEIESMFEHGKDKEKPDLSPDIKAIGVELAGEDIPMPDYPSGFAPLPMTIDEAQVARKKYKWKDSIAWLSDLIVYHWKKLKSGKKTKEI